MRKFAIAVRHRRVRLLILLLVVAAVAGFGYYARATAVMPQATIHFLSDVRLPEAGEKVLVFSPHPDDETIGVGGYLCESVHRRAIVRIVLITDGNKHNLEARRYMEFRKATKALGVPAKSLVFLEYPDGKLRKQRQAELCRVFRGEVESFDPDIVIYPHPDDGHPDHRTTGRIVQAVLDSGVRKRTAYQYLVHHPRFPQPKKLRPKLYILPPISTVTFDREWRRLLLTTSDEARKKEAIRCYRTQLRVPMLRSLLLSSIRRNELFSVAKASDP